MSLWWAWFCDFILVMTICRRTVGATNFNMEEMRQFRQFSHWPIYIASDMFHEFHPLAVPKVRSPNELPMTIGACQFRHTHWVRLNRGVPSRELLWPWGIFGVCRPRVFTNTGIFFKICILFLKETGFLTLFEDQLMLTKPDPIIAEEGSLVNFSDWRFN